MEKVSGSELLHFPPPAVIAILYRGIILVVIMAQTLLVTSAADWKTGNRDGGEYIRREVNILSLTNHDISSMSSICYLVHNELDKQNQKQFKLNFIFKIIDILLFKNVYSKSSYTKFIKSSFNCIIYNDVLGMFVCFSVVI